ncbi:hypothetical protein TRFO_35758 [Tritrichomonas foetus]|uniref:Uncharacterized protein n=1 Tax=Tritrichomonas foetus TaxID=1144522 RepID=A0A1J4JFK1_9EUKA|nr:hypothetical protein TRFO_35758 [Tritrichomonas foetus]|eukprot:OHS97922.1 hypothetical protein TRFO_35758 [Tritrichomonas foetus]
MSEETTSSLQASQEEGSSTIEASPNRIHRSHFGHTILTFQLEYLYIKLPQSTSFVICLLIDDKKLIFSPKAFPDIDNKFSVGFRTQKLISSKHNASNTRAKTRRIRLTLTIFDQEKKIIATGNTAINPGLFYGEEKLKLRPLTINLGVVDPCPLIFFGLTLLDPNIPKNEDGTENEEITSDMLNKIQLEEFDPPDTLVVTKKRIHVDSSDDEFSHNPDESEMKNNSLDKNDESKNENSNNENDDEQYFKINNPIVIKQMEKRKIVPKIPRKPKPQIILSEEEKRKINRLQTLMNKRTIIKKDKPNELNDKINRNALLLNKVLSKMMILSGTSHNASKRSKSCEPIKIKDPKLFFNLKIIYCFSFCYAPEDKIISFFANDAQFSINRTTDDISNLKRISELKKMRKEIEHEIQNPELRKIALSILQKFGKISTNGLNGGKMFIDNKQNLNSVADIAKKLVIDEVCADQADVDADADGNLRTRLQRLEREAKIKFYLMRKRRYNNLNRPKVLTVTKNFDFDWVNEDWFTDSSDEE